MTQNRRAFFHTIGAGAGLSVLSSSCATTGLRYSGDDQVLFIGDDVAVVETAFGKVRGYILRDIYHFLGIPYGADTSEKNRFMLPQKPEPWRDILPAIWWGNSAPQNMDNRYANRAQSFVDHWNYDDVSENCLAINVWTPGYADGTKRPVLLWLHGGGFTNGNAIEQDGYMGENLSRFGDMVFCSVNHRLGPLGFTNLAGVAGEKYAASGNVGMLDIVTALVWIRDNITNFGGDPGNVTIMGQSGGGAKVTTLTAMPSAKGLFHKAVVLSGASLYAGEKMYSEQLGAYVLKEAGLSRSQVDQLQKLSWQDYYAVATSASRKFRTEVQPAAGRRGGFSPVVDGSILPQHPYYPEPSPVAADIPMLICSTMNEMSPSRDNAELENITLEQVTEKIKDRAGFSAGFGDKSMDVVQAYARTFPDKKPIEIWSLISSNRQRTVQLADAKAKQNPPVYVAWFCWQPPLFDNRLRAFHCSDICFWFHNTNLMLTHTGGGARPRKLAEKMARSLLQFMKTGNPNGGGLPQWPRYTSEKGETMVLNDVSEVQYDPDREARKALPA
ncbi:carboxylesterase/lipase family protein [candidate division KSB1 bacterium]|nr:carboxylesterase/lipase family protein [candidate division KSB1 bacterium]RQW05400.1 MAG: carboxylesterase/lipase family protein [candidate division KSB1 bacterium]